MQLKPYHLNVLRHEAFGGHLGEDFEHLSDLSARAYSLAQELHARGLDVEPNTDEDNITTIFRAYDPSDDNRLVCEANVMLNRWFEEEAGRAYGG